MWYKGKEEILKQLETSSKGITNSEANKRLKEEGLNRIPTGKRNTIWNIIIEQLKNPIIFILKKLDVSKIKIKELVNTFEKNVDEFKSKIAINYFFSIFGTNYNNKLSSLKTYIQQENY